MTRRAGVVCPCKAIAALEDAGCDLVEQPIALSSRAGIARLAAASRIPVIADEALHGPEMAFDFAAHAAADVFAVKIAQSGGLFAAARVAAIADAAGIGLYGGTMLEGAVATIASAQLFATFPELEWRTELFGPLLLSYREIEVNAGERLVEASWWISRASVTRSTRGIRSSRVPKAKSSCRYSSPSILI